MKARNKPQTPSRLGHNPCPDSPVPSPQVGCVWAAHADLNLAVYQCCWLWAVSTALLDSSVSYGTYTRSAHPKQVGAGVCSKVSHGRALRCHCCVWLQPADGAVKSSVPLKPLKSVCGVGLTTCCTDYKSVLPSRSAHGNPSTEAASSEGRPQLRLPQEQQPRATSLGCPRSHRPAVAAVAGRLQTRHPQGQSLPWGCACPGSVLPLGLQCHLGCQTLPAPLCRCLLRHFPPCRQQSRQRDYGGAAATLARRGGLGFPGW